MEQPGSAKKGNRLWLIPKALVSIALLYVAFSSTDTAGAVGVISSVPAWAWFLGALLLCAQIPQLAGRWTLVLSASGKHLAYAQACSFTYTGYFFNQALPSSVGGDFMRAYLAWKNGMAFQPALASVFLERATGLFILTLFSALLLREEPIPLVSGLTHWDLVVLVLVMAFAGLLLLALMKSLVSRLPGPARLVEFLAELGGQFLNLLRKRKLFMAVFLLGGLSSLTGATAMAVGAMSLDLPVTYLQVVGISSLAIVVTVIPVSISGWGIRENVMIWLMTPLGVPAEQALGLSIWFGLVSIIAAIPGGVLWLKSD